MASAARRPRPSTHVPQPEPPKTVSVLDFHRGNTLMNLAKTYASLPQTLIEAVQNSIDGEAQRIMVFVDYEQRSAVVADDGLGVDKSRFEEALMSVGQTVKRADQLGRFGLGLISPLNKCSSFTFESVPMPGLRGGVWTFAAKDIRAQANEITIPYQEVYKLPKLPKLLQPYATGEFDRIWRTVMTMRGLIADKVTIAIDPDELQSEMLVKLGVRMREKRIKVRLVIRGSNGQVLERDICAADYTGEPLKVISFLDKDAGKVEFELYRAQKLSGKRSGVVTMSEMGNPAAVSIAAVARQARSGKLREYTEPAMNALTSGYFEGVIRCQNITLHPDRTKFEYNDPFQALLLSIAMWFEEHGMKYFEDEREVAREQRYQDLGLKSQEHIKSFLRLPEFSRYRDALQRVIKNGRMGEGHVMPGRGRPDGLESMTTTRVGQGGVGKPRTPSATPTPPRQPGTAPKDRPGDIPLGVIGPDGNRRRLVRGDSQGLWFEHTTMPGNLRLWEFDHLSGVLSFNVRHPVWVTLEETNGHHTAKHDRQLMQLQEWLSFEVLALLAQFPEKEQFDEMRVLIDERIKPYVSAFILNK